MKRKFLSILLTLAMALTLLPTAAMADETPSEGGESTPTVEYVAQIGEAKYETLQAAINAAKSGSTVRLLANVTLTETAVFPAGKTVHLNLVGHNITATGTALLINGTTDIQDTSNTGIIESTGNVAVAVGNNAKVTVYSGTLKGREGAVITGTSTGAKIEIRTTKPTLIATDNAVIAGNGSQRDGEPNTILIKGGTFIGGIQSEGYIACGIYAPWNDNVTVSGGTFNITNGAGIVARAGTVKVKGGTFNCSGNSTGWVGDNKNQIPCAALVFDKAANYPALTDSSQILVSGGSFSTDPAANGATLADGYVAALNSEGMYKVGKENPVAEINGVKYDTLQSAITAAQATKGGATITLLKNINTKSYYTVNGENPVTIDLNGHNITGSGISGLFYVTAKGDLTIKGEGIVTAVEDNGAAMAVWVRSPIAKVTLEGGTYTQQITNTNDPHFDLIYVERGNVYVKGGTYKGFTPDWTLNCKDEYYQSKEANIEVTGGTFVGFDPANNKAEGVNTSFLPEGYTSTKNADGTYTAKKVTYVARIGETRYETLTAAIAAAQNGETVTLLKDVTADITIPAGKTITLDLNGKKLTVPTDAGILVQGKLTVTGNGTVTCEKTPFMVDAGELIIENGAVNSDKDYGIYAKNGGQITVNGGTLTSSFAVLSGNNTTGDMNFTVNGGTLTSKSSEAIYMPGQQTLIINGGVINGGISARMGQITVNGGVINGMTASQTADAMKDYYNYSGSAWIGDAIYVWGGTYKSDNANGNKTNLTINGGTINGNAHRAIAIYDIGTNYEQEISVNISNANVSGDVVLDKTYGNHTHNVTTNISITGGLFSSDPSAYVAAGHYVDASNNGDYPYTVKEGTKTDAPIIVKDATDVTVPDSEAIKGLTNDDKTNIANKSSVDGVAEAIADNKAALIPADVNTTDAKKVEIEVTVKVNVTGADLTSENKTLTFEASPVATVTVTKTNGSTEVKPDVKVPNSLLNGAITVKLPLPEGFTPKQILHKFTGGGYEYFINETVGSKRGAGSFKIEGDCAVFTIYGFSTFELSGTVTYVEPSSGGGSSSSSRRYDVSAPSVKHGDVTVSPKRASKGDTVTITVKPDSGYELDTLTVKDASGSKIKVKDKGDGKFTFTMPASKVTVSAEFAEIETLDFADVSTDAYYYEAVKWAAKKGITGGTGDGTFNPNGACTRAHIVTFLWRAAGSPEPKSTVSFADVPAGSYYAKAVAWAVENGITLGTGDGTFSPNATCTRAQSVTFLYRALGTAPTTVNGFTDVTADAFYADAVAWAVESGVTNGTSASTFSPNNGCTRAQIVTFLYRTMK